MPKQTEKVRVKISSGIADGEHFWTVEARADSALFQLSDVFAQKGVIKGPESSLREMVRQAIVEYMGGADAVLAKVKTNGKGE